MTDPGTYASEIETALSGLRRIPDLITPPITATEIVERTAHREAYRHGFDAAIKIACAVECAYCHAGATARLIGGAWRHAWPTDELSRPCYGARIRAASALETG